MKFYLTILTLFIGINLFAQGVGINETNDTPDASAMLDVKSNNKGFLLPRMTSAERYAISNPAEGLLVFDTDQQCFAVYKASAWYLLCGTIDPAYQRVLVVVSGNNQAGCPSSTLGAPVVVRVVDGNGTAISGETVTFTVASGGGTITTTAVTNGSGLAQATWTLGASGTQAASVSGTNMTAQSLSASAGGVILSTGTITDSRDGQTYTTVTYCNGQTWMSQNLNYSNGGRIGLYNPSNPSTTYGRLYNWAELLGISTFFNANNVAFSTTGLQGLCPSGWHVPSDAEWQTLETFLGVTNASSGFTIRGTNQGTEMKSTTGWTSGAGTNALGFNVLPAGRHNGTSYSSFGSSGFIWTSTQNTATQSWYRVFGSTITGIGRFPYDKTVRQSCRCLED